MFSELGLFLLITPPVRARLPSPAPMPVESPIDRPSHLVLCPSLLYTLLKISIWTILLGIREVRYTKGPTVLLSNPCLPYCSFKHASRLRELLAIMFILRDVLSSLGTLTRGQTSASELLRTMESFDCRTQQCLAKINHRFQSKRSRLTTKSGRLHEWLDDFDTHFHHLCIQFCSTAPTLDNTKLKLSSLSAKLKLIDNKRHQNSIDTNSKRGTKRGQALDYCCWIPF